MHFYNDDVINEELPGNMSCRQFSLYLPPGHHRCTPPCILWYIRGRVVNIEWVRIESGYCLEKYVKGCVKTFNFHLQVNWPSKWPIIFFFHEKFVDFMQNFSQIYHQIYHRLLRADFSWCPVLSRTHLLELAGGVY